MADDWLQARVADAPSPLRERLEAQVAGLDTAAGLPEALVAAACGLLEGVRDDLERREAAFDLLVADGLLTLACEAAAYSDPETLAERCRAMGPSGGLGRLAELWMRRE
jgi:hypothetical protein